METEISQQCKTKKAVANGSKKRRRGDDKVGRRRHYSLRGSLDEGAMTRMRPP